MTDPNKEPDDDPVLPDAEDDEDWVEHELHHELSYRSYDQPFCACTTDKTRFLNLVGVLDGCHLTQGGERVAVPVPQRRHNPGTPRPVTTRTPATRRLSCRSAPLLLLTNAGHRGGGGGTRLAARHRPWPPPA